ncbi:MAG: P-loop NTPase [Gemmatimonadetes bacterium]|nr:P-loop NTPase [Gemmatimonadota bacterium]
MSFRTYRDVTGPDASRVLDQVGAQRARVRDRLATVRRVVAVMSGKGGVGKSFVTAALARLGAARWLERVGVLDADLRSPTVARLLGAAGPLRVTDAGVHPAVGAAGVRVISTEFLLETGRPLAWREPEAEQFVWRGTLEVGVLREFLGDVWWGDLELLLVDLPPGADGVADLRDLVPEMTGALGVTIPTDEARQSVARALRAATEAGIRLLGIIENMAGYQCGECGRPGPLFPGDAGPALAAEFGVPLLARIPFLAGAHEPVFEADAQARVFEVLG